MRARKDAVVNSTGHICMICGFIPSTKNKYRELQDHLVRKHFNDRIKAALPTKRPYMCPEPSCTIEGKDWQALMRHFTGKHGVLERYLREIIDAGVDEPADPKLRKVSTKSRLNPNGTAPAIQLQPEQIEQMERQALAVSAEERMILQGGDGSLATVLQTAAAPPLPNHKIQGGHKMPRRKRPSRNSTGSISSPESLQDEDDGNGIVLGMGGIGGDNNASGSVGGGGMLFPEQPFTSELEEKEQPQLALVFKRPKSDPNGEDAYAFIDLQSFLASTTYIRNPAELVAKAANENVRLGVLATPLSPPPEQDEFEPTKTEQESDVKPVLVPSQPETQQQQQVQSNAQADTRVVFSSQQQQQQQFQPPLPLPPPITSPSAIPGGDSAHLPPGTATSSTATALALEQAGAVVASSAAAGQAMISSAPVLQQDQQQVDQPQTITVFNSVPAVDQGQPQFQDLQLDQHHQIVIPPTQEIPPHVEQQMLQAVQQQQQQQQQTYVIQQAVDLEQSTLAAGGTVLYAQQQMPLAATEQFSLAGNETIVISQEQLEQMLGPVYLDNQTVQVFNPSTVQLPTEPVQIQEVEGATGSTNIGLQQEQQLQPQHQVHNQCGQRVVVEQVGSLPIEASTSTSEQTDQPSREVHESAAKVESAAPNATVASNKVDNLQDVKEIDFSMF